MIWTEAEPKPSQIIRTNAGFYYHYGIYISDDEVIQFGLPDDPCRPADCVRVLSSDIDTFMCGNHLETGIPTSEEKKSMRNVKQIIEIARSKIGEGGYDILHNNCEHFVNECVFGEKRSTFVDCLRNKIRQQLQK